MLPLMKMAWTLNRRLLLQGSPIFAMYLAQLVVIQHGAKAAPFIVITLAITGLATAIITLQGLTLPVEGFVLSLPISRDQVVQAKYATSMLGLAIGLALTLVTPLAAHRVAPAWAPLPSLATVGLVALGGLILAMGIICFLPLVYRFGPSEGLMIFAASVILLPAGALAWKGAMGCMDILESLGNRWLEQRSFAMGLVAAVLLSGLGSLKLSLKSYRHRMT